jgi:hypothetical protein
MQAPSLARRSARVGVGGWAGELQCTCGIFVNKCKELNVRNVPLDCRVADRLLHHPALKAMKPAPVFVYTFLLLSM